MKSKADLHNDLYSLGQSSQAVAASLRAKKIKGAQRRAYAYPIANYLKQAGYTNPIVGCMGIIYGEKDDATTAHTPSFIEHFLHDFDSGVYPDLIDEAAIECSF